MTRLFWRGNDGVSGEIIHQGRGMAGSDEELERAREEERIKLKISKEEKKYVNSMIEQGIFRKATGEEYAKWIRGYCAAGGKVGVYGNRVLAEYQEDDQNWGYVLIAQKDFEFQPTLVLRINIIVPSGIKYLGGKGLEATYLLYMDGYLLVGDAGSSRYACDDVIYYEPWIFDDTPELVEEWRACGSICKIRKL